VVRRYVGIRSGTEKEFQEALAIVDQRVGELAALKVDVVLLQGASRSCCSARSLIGKTMIQIDALKSLGAKSLVGADLLSRRFESEVWPILREGRGSKSKR
jgi:hypothetical protein